MVTKTAKNQWNCIVLNFNQIKASLFQYKFKVSFPQRARNCLLHATTNHFFSFHLCPIGNTLTYSVRYYPCGNISSQSLTGLYNPQTDIMHAYNCPV